MLVLVAEGVFSPSSSSVHIWRILTGRVSIKEGSTMKKIAGAKGQVGGGQQGERGRNGSRTAAFGCAFVWRRRVCGVCVCLRVHTCSSRERPKCGRKVCQVTLFHPPKPLSLPRLFLSFSLRLAATLVPSSGATISQLRLHSG